MIENFEHILFSVDKIQLKIIQMRRQSTEKVWFWEFVSNRRLCVVLLVGGKVIVDYRRKLGLA